MAGGGGSTGSVSVSGGVGCFSGLSGRGWVDPALRRCWSRCPWIIAHDLGGYFRTRMEVSSEMDKIKPASITVMRVDRAGEHSAP